MRVLLIFSLFVVGGCDDFIQLFGGDKFLDPVVNLHEDMDHISDLGSLEMDNIIKCIYRIGLWLLYDDVNFKGRVYYVEPDKKWVDLPPEYRDTFSSLRRIKTRGADKVSLFRTSSFTGEELQVWRNAEEIDLPHNKACSLIVIGKSPWTVYTGKFLDGDKACVNATVKYEEKLIGFYPTVKSMGLSEPVKSIVKGCYA
ncbi:uncharacterized protein LOC135103600 [Scylla paramamosain]|uniref:uncharacterized protein LOC135103600 n=1 Tax=Scylla paramamosain TaxID=85552 RepID=UPI0030829836